MFCGNCGRKLKDPKSIERGFGPSCWMKLHPEDKMKTSICRQKKCKVAEPCEVAQVPGQINIIDYLGENPEKGVVNYKF